MHHSFNFDDGVKELLNEEFPHFKELCFFLTLRVDVHILGDRIDVRNVSRTYLYNFLVNSL